MTQQFKKQIFAKKILGVLKIPPTHTCATNTRARANGASCTMCSLTYIRYENIMQLVGQYRAARAHT